MNLCYNGNDNANVATEIKEKTWIWIIGCFHKEQLTFVHLKLFLFEPTWIQ
jgi:hypothetical protein